MIGSERREGNEAIERGMASVPMSSSLASPSTPGASLALVVIDEDVKRGDDDVASSDVASDVRAAEGQRGVKRDLASEVDVVKVTIASKKRVRTEMEKERRTGVVVVVDDEEDVEKDKAKISGQEELTLVVTSQEDARCFVCGDTPSEVTFSRCQHRICGGCGGEAVSTQDGRELREFAICPVKKCRAPLSAEDTKKVIALRTLDTWMAEKWEQQKADIRAKIESRSRFGEGAIFGEGRAKFEESRVDGGWLVTDPVVAFAPLWRRRDGPSRWTCRVCGGEERASGAKRVDHAHCPEARLFGILQIVRKLRKRMSGVDVSILEMLEDHNVSSVDDESSDEVPFGLNSIDGKSKTKRSSSKRRNLESGLAEGTGYGGRKGERYSFAARQKVRDEEAAVAYWLGLSIPYIDQENTNLRTCSATLRHVLLDTGYIAILEGILSGPSMIEIGASPEIYLAAMTCVVTLARGSYLEDLLRRRVKNSALGLVGIMSELTRNAAILSATGAHEFQAPSTKAFLSLLRRARRITKHLLPSSEGEEEDDAENGGEISLAERYENALKPLQFDFVRGLSSCFSFHSVALAPEALQGGALHAKGRLAHLANEIASLSNSLPLSIHSTICLRVDEDRYDCMRALIFGPDGTPYANGAFMFDIFLPWDYPDSPPRVNFLTTAGGRVRFNPNLYQDGKVCLSLLGTWSGPSWTRESTLLQVLVSIQALILVPEPFFNEPGYEKSAGTPRGKQSSEVYNNQIRKHTVKHAICDALEYCDPIFSKATRTHFAMKRDSVVVEVQSWISAPQVSTSSHADVVDLLTGALSASRSTSGALTDTDVEHLQALLAPLKK